MENLHDKHLPQMCRAHCIESCIPWCSAPNVALQCSQEDGDPLAWFKCCHFFAYLASSLFRSFRMSVFDFAQGHAHVFTRVKLAGRSVHSQICKVIWIHCAEFKNPPVNRLKQQDHCLTIKKKIDIEYDIHSQELLWDSTWIKCCAEEKTK